MDDIDPVGLPSVEFNKNVTIVYKRRWYAINISFNILAYMAERCRCELECIYWGAVTVSRYVVLKTEGSRITSVQSDTLKQQVQLFNA